MSGALPFLGMRILLIDDNAADAEVVRRSLERIPDIDISFEHVLDVHAGLAILLGQPVDCLLLDYMLGALTGLQVLAKIRAANNDVPTILLTGTGNEDVAVEAMKRGAQDYLVKDVLVREVATPNVLRRAILNATEKVALERRMFDRQQDLEQFASVVAHDFRSPICTVKSNLEVLRDFYGDALDDKGTDFLHSSIDTVDRMGEMVEVLLEYALLGKGTRAHGAVDCQVLLDEVKTDLAGELRSAGAELDVGALPTVVGDAVYLRQLFQNLISNAVKFRREEAPQIGVHAENDGRSWTFTVADNGIGIDTHDLRKIFSPFQRLRRSRDTPGYGIGLATVKRIAEHHGARIWVQSELGVGTKFSLGPFREAS